MAQYFPKPFRVVFQLVRRMDSWKARNWDKAIIILFSLFDKTSFLTEENLLNLRLSDTVVDNRKGSNHSSGGTDDLGIPQIQWLTQSNFSLVFAPLEGFDFMARDRAGEGERDRITKSRRWKDCLSLRFVRIAFGRYAWDWAVTGYIWKHILVYYEGGCEHLLRGYSSPIRRGWLTSSSTTCSPKPEMSQDRMSRHYSHIGR